MPLWTDLIETFPKTPFSVACGITPSLCDHTPLGLKNFGSKIRPRVCVLCRVAYSLRPYSSTPSALLTHPLAYSLNAPSPRHFLFLVFINSLPPTARKGQVPRPLKARSAYFHRGIVEEEQNALVAMCQVIMVFSIQVFWSRLTN